MPNDLSLGEKDVAAWQLNAWSWQALAEHLYGQRVETAVCLVKMRENGAIK